MNTRLQHIAFACLLATATSGAFAQNLISSSVYGNAKDQVKAVYKTEREACKSLTANAKDVCEQTAEGREEVALAHLQVQRSGSTEDRRKLAEARVEARYDVAKEMCDDLSGNAKDVCVTQAKTEFDKRKADIKMNKEVTEARNDADDTKMKADYKLANERCDSLSGEAKDSCVASAKARYGM
jgi:hypothetical protein